MAILEIVRPSGPLSFFYAVWFDRLIPLAEGAAGRRGVHLSAGERAALSDANSLEAEVHEAGFDPVRTGCSAEESSFCSSGRPHERTSGRPPTGFGRLPAQLEERLQATAASHRGTVAEAGAESLAAGGKRLKPLLVFLARPPSRCWLRESRSSSSTWPASSTTT